MAKLDFWDALLLSLISIHLVVSPYTKVEESFNTQAIYDFVNHGLNFAKFDHLEFPGAVPRSFFGAALIGSITRFFNKYAKFVTNEDPTQIQLQLLARAILGLFNGLGLIALRHAVIDTVDLVYLNPKLYDVSILETAAATTIKDEKTGKEATIVEEQVEVEATANDDTNAKPQEADSKPHIGLWFALFQYTQFHIVYYSSRFLPNFIALPLTNIALALAIKTNYPLAFAILSFTAIVIRFEVFVLLGALFFTSVFIFGKAPFLSSVSSIVFGTSVGGLVSLFLDTKIWNPSLELTSIIKDPSVALIPEISSFIFNVIHSNASNWGVEPFSAYFDKYFRKLFFPPTVISLAATGLFNDPTKSLYSVTIVSVASLLHVLVMSFQPHKEWRFIVYAIPGITLLGASGVGKLAKSFRTSFFSKIAVVATLLSAVVSLGSSVFMLYSSSLNYPGGVALNSFNNYIIARNNNGTLPANQELTVHLSIYPKMTGASLFGELQESFLLQNNISLKYDKTENVTDLKQKWGTFDYIITEIDLSKPVSSDEINDKKEAQVSEVDQIKNDIASVSSGIQWYKIASVSQFAGVTPRPLLNAQNGQFDPKGKLTEVVQKIVDSKSVEPILDVIKEAVLKRNVVYVFEKQHLV